MDEFDFARVLGVRFWLKQGFDYLLLVLHFMVLPLRYIACELAANKYRGIFFRWHLIWLIFNVVNFIFALIEEILEIKSGDRQARGPKERHS